jgi:hypothetical protein
MKKNGNNWTTRRTHKNNQHAEDQRKRARARARRREGESKRDAKKAQEIEQDES